MLQSAFPQDHTEDSTQYVQRSGREIEEQCPRKGTTGGRGKDHDETRDGKWELKAATRFGVKGM